MQSRPPMLALLSTVGLLCAGQGMLAQTPSPQLATVLAQMDTASKTFRSTTADFQWDFVEKIGSMTDTTRQMGSMYIERGKDGSNFGAAVFEIGPDGKPVAAPSKIIDYSAGSLQVYTPAEKQEDLLKAGANQNRAENFLTLGFGGSGHDLAQAWQVTDGGPETLNQNGKPTKTEKLILVSKDPNVRNTFRQVTIWIEPAQDISLKQVFDTPSGDQRTAYYSNIRLNQTVHKDPYKIPTKGVTVVPH